MHTIFRIGNTKSMGEKHRLFQVELSLTSDNDPDLRALTDRMREETEGSTGWHQLGRLLLKMSQPTKAQQVYEIMLQQPSNNDKGKADIYRYLGWGRYDQGEYEEAIVFYEKSFEIKLRTLSLNDPALAHIYNNIAIVYRNMGDYSKALSYYEKDLEISQETLPPNHPDLAATYNNIGTMYENIGDYEKARLFLERAVDIGIGQHSLPSDHPR